MDDPMFARPYVDADEWRDAPVRHRYVHGGFEGTETRFSFYFPPREQYEGRFFQHVTPVPDSENLAPLASLPEEDKIGFSIASGAYFVETNGGGIALTGKPSSQSDPTITAYRANAASAQYSRALAAKMYGDHRPYGYIYGGSGGGYRTIGSLENTTGVWDGGVPYVIGSPMSIPNVFCVRMHAMRILRDRFPQIIDALEPGGSGDPHAGLNAEEREALREVTRMGFPPGSWFGYESMGVHAFSVLYEGMLLADPKYFEEFWTVPGYLGANPPPSLLAARVQHRSTIEAPLTADEAEAIGLDAGRIPGQARGAADTAWQAMLGDASKRPVAYRLTSTPPDVGFLGGDLLVRSGAAAGRRVALRQIAGDVVILGVADAAVLAQIAPGDEVQVDNSNFLAAQTYHRHQVPGPDFEAWDQFRWPNGEPIYPQRPMVIGPLFVKAASGSVQEGRFAGKMIVVEALWDREAYPWQADWYRSRVKEHLGGRIDDHFRLWYVDRALHPDSSKQDDPTRTVAYVGVLHQALRDLAAWVEKGVTPLATTNYRMLDGQVMVPGSAAERRGVQPVVTLEVDGAKRADVAVGEPVTLIGVIEVPPGAGQVVAAEWDFEGAGAFPVAADLAAAGADRARVKVAATHRFAAPGTYFPTLRAASQRQGDARTPFARIQNLDRVRVVVK